MFLSLKIISMELKRIFSYRITFWIKFFLEAIIDIAVAFYLWSSIFKFNSISTLNGYSLNSLIYYYAFASFTSRITAKELDSISRDIYDGSLTKYLVYPTSFFKFKYLNYFSQQLISILQCFLGLFICYLILKSPFDFPSSISNYLIGIIFCFYLSFLNFLILSSIEQISFWQDVVWNLRVMYRFIASILGGLYIPLNFFPESFAMLLKLTPFPYFYSVPIQIFLDKYNYNLLYQDLIVSTGWILIFIVINKTLWKKGKFKYTGVGI